jgi:hypothetical protein
MARVIRLLSGNSWIFEGIPATIEIMSDPLFHSENPDAGDAASRCEIQSPIVACPAWIPKIAAGFVRVAVATLLLIIIPAGYRAHAQSADPPDAEIEISDRIIRAILTTRRSQSNPVNKQLLGADIHGTQTTDTLVRPELVKSSRSLQINLINTGTICSTTTGMTRDAIVQNIGNHHFDVIKPVIFDGTVVRTLPAYGVIRASQRPVRVRSTASGLPLIGQIADQIAWSEVLRRSTQIEDTVARDLATDVLPEVDSATDVELAQLNRTLNLWKDRIPSSGAFSNSAWTATSTNSSAKLSLYLSENASDVNHKQGFSDNVHLISEVSDHDQLNENDLVFTLSERLATSVASYLIPDGRVVSDRVLNQLMSQSDDQPERSLIQAIRDVVSVQKRTESQGNAEESSEMFSLHFSEHTPLQIQFNSGEIRIRSTFQIVTRPGLSSGWQQTEMRLAGRNLTNSEWTIVSTGSTAQEIEQINNSPVNQHAAAKTGAPGPTEVTSGTAWSALVRNTLINLGERLKDTRIPKSFQIPGRDQSSISLQLYRIQSENGRLRITFRQDKQL